MSADSVIVFQPESVVLNENDLDLWRDSNALFTGARQVSLWSEVVNEDTSIGHPKISLSDYVVGICKIHPGDQYQRAFNWQKATTSVTERKDAERIAFVRAYLHLMNEGSLGDRLPTLPRKRIWTKAMCR